jgi:transcriptional regulator with XRE-family HTH domain
MQHYWLTSAIPMNPIDKRVRKNYGLSELTQVLERIRGEISSFRETEGISQAEFARRAGVSKTTVNDLENGVATDLQLSTMLMLSKVMGKAPTELIRESDLKMQNGDRKLLLNGLEELERIVDQLRKVYRKLR